MSIGGAVRAIGKISKEVSSEIDFTSLKKVEEPSGEDIMADLFG